MIQPAPRHDEAATGVLPGHQRPGWTHQRGGGSIATIGIVLVLVVVALVGVWIACWLAASSRSQGLADLVAIEAAYAQEVGGDACGRARVVAQMNQGQLNDCRVETGYGEFIVTVEVRVGLSPAIPGAPTESEHQARAGILAGD